MKPEHDECVEQAYFFRNFRERLAENMSAQDLLNSLHEEVLTTTRLPFAIQLLATEMKHSGRISSGFGLLPHYFTAFQTFIISQAEDDKSKLSMPVALLILEREAAYKADKPTKAGLFVYQFETTARNRLGYSDSLEAISKDPFYDADWKRYIEFVRRSGGVIDFCDLVYLRSEFYVQDERRKNPAYDPPQPPIYGDREGKIAKASRGRDPLFLFAALQRQLNYPQVPRAKAKDDIEAKLDSQATKIRELETRLRMLESEQRGQFDPTQFGKPDAFRNLPDDV
ncbi:MAG: hypothetical protein ACRC8S_15650 [Fimbriiglobus sp.]